MQSLHPGRLILTGLPGTELTPELAATYRRLQPGGYILFVRNMQSAVQLRKLVDDLRDLSRHDPIITIDQEGGRVSRLRQIGNEPPNPAQLRTLGDVDLIRRHGALTGRLMRLFGMNLNLCPVLDISFDDDADNSLRGRCYGKTPTEVIENAEAFRAAMSAEGILSCGKHFPGYSAAGVDPHHELPEIHRTREELEGAELIPFRKLTPKLDSIMTGHTWYPAFDSEKIPASLSRTVITDLLRKEMGFGGLIMTDDLDMGALLEKYTLEESVLSGLAAGNDLLMICHRVQEIGTAIAALDHAPRAEVDRALERLAAFESKQVAPDPFSEQAFASLDQEVWDLRVATLGEEQARERSPDIRKVSPVELF